MSRNQKVSETIAVMNKDWLTITLRIIGTAGAAIALLFTLGTIVAATNGMTESALAFAFVGIGCAGFAAIMFAVARATRQQQ